MATVRRDWKPIASMLLGHIRSTWLAGRRAAEEDHGHPGLLAVHHHPVPHAPEPPVRQHLHARTASSVVVCTSQERTKKLACMQSCCCSAAYGICFAWPVPFRAVSNERLLSTAVRLRVRVRTTVSRVQLGA